MHKPLAFLAAALIMSAPVLAAPGSSSAPSSNSAAAGGHAGGSGGGAEGGGHGGGALGAHSAALSTHLGGSGHILNPASSHALTGRTRPQRLALGNDTSKKPGHGHDHASHIFLHRGSAHNQFDWASLCLRTFTEPDGRWSDCGRPAKSRSSPHS